MNIEEIREFALGLNEHVTEDLFDVKCVSWRIQGKWFLLMHLDAPEPYVAVKLPPDVGIEMRERYDGVRPAFHMNKTHWSDLYLNVLDDSVVKELITISFNIVVSKLPKSKRV